MNVFTHQLFFSLVSITLLTGVPSFSEAQINNDPFTSTTAGKMYRDLKTAMKDPDKVYYLDLSRKGLTTVPEELLNFPQLVFLNLSQNDLESLDGIDWSWFAKLEKLYLFSNELTGFPEEVTKCKNLTHLNLAGNDIDSIPESINNCRFLSILEMPGNRIHYLTEEWDLKYLITVDFQFNRIRELPEDFFTNKPRLTTLNLNHNKLTKLPETIQDTYLENIDLGKNNITNVKVLEGMKSIRVLILNHNLLSSEDVEALTTLKRLESLHAGNCGIQSLPNDLSKWKFLTELSLAKNNIEELPPELWELKRLETLWLTDNPIEVETLDIPDHLTVHD